MRIQVKEHAGVGQFYISW